MRMHAAVTGKRGPARSFRAREAECLIVMGTIGSLLQRNGSRKTSFEHCPEVHAKYGSNGAPFYKHESYPSWPLGWLPLADQMSDLCSVTSHPFGR